MLLYSVRFCETAQGAVHAHCIYGLVFFLSGKWCIAHCILNIWTLLLCTLHIAHCTLHIWTRLLFIWKVMHGAGSERSLSYESLHCFRVSAVWINGAAGKVQPWMNWKLHFAKVHPCLPLKLMQLINWMIDFIKVNPIERKGWDRPQRWSRTIGLQAIILHWVFPPDNPRFSHLDFSPLSVSLR